MIIDTSVLDAYREFMEEEADAFIKEILDGFYENAEALFTTLVNAPDETNLEEYMRSAHTLKSTSATVGATRLSKISASIEEQCKQGALDEIPALIPELREAYKEAKAELQRIYS